VRCYIITKLLIIAQTTQSNVEVYR